MSFKAYNYYRAIGFAPAEAMELAAGSPDVPDMYEEKGQVDTGSHGGFAPVIGLTDEFKALVRAQEAV